MVERYSKQSQAVVFQSSDGTLTWDNINDLELGARIIREREDQGYTVVSITSPKKAIDLINQQAKSCRQEFIFPNK